MSNAILEQLGFEYGVSDVYFGHSLMPPELTTIIFVRWKPTNEQPMGLKPDLNDSVSLNIRRFMTAKDMSKKASVILREKNNVHWKKTVVPM